MAELKLQRRWEAWAPTLDGNHELERPFYFELACGLTRTEMRALDNARDNGLRERLSSVRQENPLPDLTGLNEEEGLVLTKAWGEKLAEALIAAEIEVVSTVLEPYVRLGTEPLTIAGKRITTLREYLEAVAQVADMEALMEVPKALDAANSLEGRQRLFSKRPSGGSSTTRGPNAAKGKSQGAGR